MKILRYLVFYTGKFTNQSGHPQKDGKIRLHKCTGKSIAQIKKKNPVNKPCLFEKIGYGIEKHTANENMGEKKMADGFLAPTGKFYPKTENFHAQTARVILGPDGQTDEPIQELLRRGYILFVGFHKPGEPENLHADMDYVLGGPGYPATEGQKAWIAEHTEELSRKQQFDINNDETTFENFYISNVRMFPWCKGCAEEKARDLWGNAQSEEKPKRCDACPAFRNRPL